MGCSEGWHPRAEEEEAEEEEVRTLFLLRSGGVGVLSAEVGRMHAADRKLETLNPKPCKRSAVETVGPLQVRFYRKKDAKTPHGALTVVRFFANKHLA